MGQAWHSRGGLNALQPGERIGLVIEPESAQRAQAGSALRGMGYKTYATGCGAVGQFIASQLSVDLIVISAVLPDLDGLQLIRQLRVRVPEAVIVATALESENWDAKALLAYAAGADFALRAITRSALASVLDGRPRHADNSTQQSTD